jgi:HK97 family phage major capsid protein
MTTVSDDKEMDVEEKALPEAHVLQHMQEEPEAFNAEAKEELEDTLQKTVDEMVKERVSQALRSSGMKRPQMSEHNDKATGAPLDGSYKSFGEFAKSVVATDKGQSDTRLKVLGEGIGDQGGFLVPEEFRAQLLSLALEDAVVRPRSFVLPMTSSTMRVPSIRDTSHASTAFGGVRGYWTAESSSYTASEPTFASLALTAKKLTGYTTASDELLADSAISLEALLIRLFSEAIAFFEDDAFINGVGSGQPVGLLNADALVTVAKETGQAASTIVYENLINMWSRLHPRSKANAVWIVHPDTFPQLAQMSLNVGTGGSPMWIANAAGGAPNSLFGRPIIESEKCQTLGTAGDIYLADLSYYVIGDRQTLTMASSSHVRFQNGEVAWRLTSRLDGRPWIDSALTPRNGSNTVSPFVNLATRS